MKVQSGVFRIAAVTIVAGVIGYLLTYLLHPIYRTSMALYFPQSTTAAPNPLTNAFKPPGADDSGSVRLLGQQLSSPLVGSGPLTAQGIMQSDTCIREVIAKHDLQNKWGISLEETIKRLRGRLATKINTYGFLDVEVQGESPEDAVALANSFYEHLKKRSSDLTVNVSASNRKFVEDQVRVAQKNVAVERKRMEAAMAASPLSNYDEDAKLYDQLLITYTEARAKQEGAKAQLQALEADLSQAAAAGKEYPNNVLLTENTNKALEKLATDLQARRQELADTVQQFQPSSKEVKSAREHVQTLEKLARSIGTAQGHIARQGLSAQQIKARSEFAANSEALAQYQRTLRRMDSNRQLAPAQYAGVQLARAQFEHSLKAYAALQDELQNAKIAEQRDPSKFEVIDKPYEDHVPVFPRRTMIGGLFALVALAVMAGPPIMRRLREES